MRVLAVSLYAMVALGTGVGLGLSTDIKCRENAWIVALSGGAWPVMLPMALLAPLPSKCP